MHGREKFYAQGLRFECTHCGNCCRLPGGKVDLSQMEISEMSRALQMGVESFKQQFCYPDSNGYRLKEQEDGACIFLKDNLCIIYEARPLQCRTFPFWTENLKSHYRWKQLRSICNGLDKGKLYPLNEIQQLLNRQRNSKSES